MLLFIFQSGKIIILAPILPPSISRPHWADTKSQTNINSIVIKSGLFTVAFKKFLSAQVNPLLRPRYTLPDYPAVTLVCWSVDKYKTKETNQLSWVIKGILKVCPFLRLGYLDGWSILIWGGMMGKQWQEWWLNSSCWAGWMGKWCVAQYTPTLLVGNNLFH